MNEERETVRAMETDSIRLRERFKHDPKRQLQIAQDWSDYASGVLALKGASELRNVSPEPDWSDDSTRGDAIAVEEIGKRVMEALGDESHLKSGSQRDPARKRTIAQRTTPTHRR